MNNLYLKASASASLAMLLIAMPAAAAVQYEFNFSTTTPLIGAAGTGSGIITVDGPVFPSRGSTAQTITGISGTFNGSAITGLASPFGANNLFYANGPSFVDGSGLGFITAAGTSVNLFFQSSGAGSYRINTINPFTSSFVAANASVVAAAVPEPSVWAVMVLGLGLVGAFMRSAARRRNLAVTYA